MNPDPSAPGRNTLHMSTVCLKRILAFPLFIYLCYRRRLALLVRPPRLQCQTHLGRFIRRRNLSGLRVIRLLLEIGARAAHFPPTLCAPPTGGAGKLTVFFPPWVIFYLGNRIRWMFGRPIHPAGKHNPFYAPYTFAIRQRGLGTAKYLRAAA